MEFHESEDLLDSSARKSQKSFKNKQSSTKKNFFKLNLNNDNPTGH